MLWTQHGGSGLGITWAEAWDLDWDELVTLIEVINERRQAETDAIRKARKG